MHLTKQLNDISPLTKLIPAIQFNHAEVNYTLLYVADKNDVLICRRADGVILDSCLDVTGDITCKGKLVGRIKKSDMRFYLNRIINGDVFPVTLKTRAESDNAWFHAYREVIQKLINEGELK